MDVLIVGSGGREHALAIGLSESSSVDKIHCCPGNFGTSQIGLNHEIDIKDINSIVNLSNNLQIDLVVVGPEAPLVSGLSDKLTEQGIPCFGPNKDCAQLEGSKLFAKKLMNKLNIPTGRFIEISNLERIDENLSFFKPPWVIKRDVLAGGKGVTVTGNIEDARDAIKNAIELDGLVLLEEYLEGEEASILVLMDESGYSILPPSQDHKRVGDEDTGPNTGGMGAYSPAPIVTPSVATRVTEEIISPMHHYLRNLDSPFRGCLFVGIMIDRDGSPKVVEFNVRFGDPEAQVTIPLIKTDLGMVLNSVATGNIENIDIIFDRKSIATVVLASENYPNKPIVGRKIFGYDSHIDEGQIRGLIHFSGTNIDANGNAISSGGRVLSATGIAPSIIEAIETAYQIINTIKLEGSHYRTDIGKRAFYK